MQARSDAQQADVVLATARAGHRVVTKELLEASCLLGTAEQLAAQLTELGEAGLDQIVVLPSLAAKEDVLRDIAGQVMPLLAAGVASG